MNQVESKLLPQDDLLKFILADMRRTVREYTTATTESSCPSVRNLFTELTDSTLRMQGDLYKMLEKHGIYSVPAGAPRKDLDKTLKEAEQACTQAKETSSRQRMSGGSIGAHTPNVPIHEMNNGRFN